MDFMAALRQMLLRSLTAGERGQDLIEYGLLASLISIIAIVSITSVGSSVSTFMSSVAAAIP